MITRRRVVIALGASAMFSAVNAAPTVGKIVRLAVVENIGDKFDPGTVSFHRALVEGLRTHGLEIGRNVVLEYRSSIGQPARLDEIATELVRLNVDIIVSIGGAPMVALHRATKTIPIVMVGASDPVESGFITSLARPGGNITGLANNATELAAKRVQLLKETVPGLSTVAVLWNSSLKSMGVQFQKVVEAAPVVGVKVMSMRLANSENFEQAFEEIRKARPGGVIVLFGPLRGNDLPRIVDFVNKNRIPTIFETNRGVKGGGLMEFGAGFDEMARGAGYYVDRIVNGVRPADLPVQEPTVFHIVINLKAAREMGINIPASVLNRADRLIE